MGGGARSAGTVCEGEFLTHDNERIASFNADRPIAPENSLNILLGLYEIAAQVVADARDHHPDAASDLRQHLGRPPQSAASLPPA